MVFQPTVDQRKSDRSESSHLGAVKIQYLSRDGTCFEPAWGGAERPPSEKVFVFRGEPRIGTCRGNWR